MLDRRLRSALRVMWISDGSADPTHITRIVEAALRGGVRAFLIREPSMRLPAIESLCRSLKPAIDAAEGVLLVHDVSAAWVDKLTHGVHWSSGHLAPGREGRSTFVSKHRLVGYSVHDEDEISRALVQRPDWVMVSPVFATKSHPDAKPLGVARARALARVARIPTLALGGIDTRNVRELAGKEFAGIACIRALTEAADPEAAARELCRVFGVE